MKGFRSSPERDKSGAVVAASVDFEIELLGSRPQRIMSPNVTRYELESKFLKGFYLGIAYGRIIGVSKGDTYYTISWCCFIQYNAVQHSSVECGVVDYTLVWFGTVLFEGSS